MATHVSFILEIQNQPANLLKWSSEEAYKDNYEDKDGSDISNFNTTSSRGTEFKLFPMLPLELRLGIWRFAANISSMIVISCTKASREPNEVSYLPYSFLDTPLRYTRFTHIPSVLRVSKEARDEAIKEYQCLPLHPLDQLSREVPHDCIHFAFINPKVDEIHLQVFDPPQLSRHYMFSFLRTTGLPRKYITAISAYFIGRINSTSVAMDLLSVVLYLKYLKTFNIYLTRLDDDTNSTSLVLGRIIGLIAQSFQQVCPDFMENILLMWLGVRVDVPRKCYVPRKLVVGITTDS